ncbi:hypothetical protein G9X67_15035 [Rhizobium sp. WYCCWR 11152]|uniref:hypothetical protein n=1 Tax=Rhizobium sp. WYCCWR 11152 TaxID=2692316 RepID=UPI0014912034|nr:hypothetical protein [Rhizobium sp. WYCCWR 11152]NNU66586.1 hypothetical protein [Rhizobium sp. WYCCWR 11152]
MASDIVEGLKWWGAKRRPPRNMPTLPADCAEGSNAIAALRTELAVKETEALGYLRAVGTLQAHIDTQDRRIAELEKALRDKFCPRPCNHRPDEFGVGDCVDAGECGCGALHALIPEKEG